MIEVIEKGDIVEYKDSHWEVEFIATRGYSVNSIPHYVQTALAPFDEVTLYRKSEWNMFCALYNAGITVPISLKHPRSAIEDAYYLLVKGL